MALNGPELLRKLASQHPGEVVEIDLGVSSIFLATAPEHAQHILIDNWRNYSKATPMWRPVKRLLGLGLATADGDTWLRNRRLLQPLFSRGQLNAMLAQMIDVATKEVDEMCTKIGGEPVDMDLQMMRTTQRIILSTLFGTSLSHHQLDTLGQAILDAFKALNIRIMLYFVPDQLLPGEQTLRRCLVTMDEGIGDLITERRRTPSGRTDLLSLLLSVHDEDGERMSDRQVRDELVTMFVAGNETTAITMTWLLYLLDRHPEIDERVRAELDAVFGDQPPTPAGIQRLEYSRRVIQEAMRIYPPVWIMPRKALEADDLCGYSIPAGANVLVSPYVLHYNEAVWESPEEFDPDRFLLEPSMARSRYAYMPFGSGPRQCIGNGFAILEALTILAVMHRRIRAKTVPGHLVVPGPATTLRPRYGLRMTLHPA